MVYNGLLNEKAFLAKQYHFLCSIDKLGLLSGGNLRKNEPIKSYMIWGSHYNSQSLITANVEYIRDWLKKHEDYKSNMNSSSSFQREPLSTRRLFFDVIKNTKSCYSGQHRDDDVDTTTTTSIIDAPSKLDIDQKSFDPTTIVNQTLQSSLITDNEILTDNLVKLLNLLMLYGDSKISIDKVKAPSVIASDNSDDEDNNESSFRFEWTVNVNDDVDRMRMFLLYSSVLFHDHHDVQKQLDLFHRFVYFMNGTITTPESDKTTNDAKKQENINIFGDLEKKNWNSLLLELNEMNDDDNKNALNFLDRYDKIVSLMKYLDIVDNNDDLRKELVVDTQLDENSSIDGTNNTILPKNWKKLIFQYQYHGGKNQLWPFHTSYVTLVNEARFINNLSVLERNSTAVTNNQFDSNVVHEKKRDVFKFVDLLNIKSHKGPNGKESIINNKETKLLLESFNDSMNISTNAMVMKKTNNTSFWMNSPLLLHEIAVKCKNIFLHSIQERKNDLLGLFPDDISKALGNLENNLFDKGRHNSIGKNMTMIIRNNSYTIENLLRFQRESIRYEIVVPILNCIMDFLPFKISEISKRTNRLVPNLVEFYITSKYYPMDQYDVSNQNEIKKYKAWKQNIVHRIIGYLNNYIYSPMRNHSLDSNRQHGFSIHWLSEIPMHSDKITSVIVHAFLMNRNEQDDINESKKTNNYLLTEHSFHDAIYHSESFVRYLKWMDVNSDTSIKESMKVECIEKILKTFDSSFNVYSAYIEYIQNKMKHCLVYRSMPYSDEAPTVLDVLKHTDIVVNNDMDDISTTVTFEEYQDELKTNENNNGSSLSPIFIVKKIVDRKINSMNSIQCARNKNKTQWILNDVSLIKSSLSSHRQKPENGLLSFGNVSVIDDNRYCDINRKNITKTIFYPSDNKQRDSDISFVVLKSRTFVLDHLFYSFSMYHASSLLSILEKNFFGGFMVPSELFSCSEQYDRKKKNTKNRLGSMSTEELKEAVVSIKNDLSGMSDVMDQLTSKEKEEEEENLSDGSVLTTSILLQIISESQRNRHKKKTQKDMFLYFRSCDAIGKVHDLFFFELNMIINSWNCLINELYRRYLCENEISISSTLSVHGELNDMIHRERKMLKIQTGEDSNNINGGGDNTNNSGRFNSSNVDYTETMMMLYQLEQEQIALDNDKMKNIIMDYIKEVGDKNQKLKIQSTLFSPEDCQGIMPKFSYNYTLMKMKECQYAYKTFKTCFARLYSMIDVSKLNQTSSNFINIQISDTPTSHRLYEYPNEIDTLMRENDIFSQLYSREPFYMESGKHMNFMETSMKRIESKDPTSIISNNNITSDYPGQIMLSFRSFYMLFILKKTYLYHAYHYFRYELRNQMFGLDHLLDEIIDVYCSFFALYDDGIKIGYKPFDSLINTTNDKDNAEVIMMKMIMRHDDLIVQEDKQLIETISEKISKIKEKVAIAKESSINSGSSDDAFVLDCMTHIWKVNYTRAKKTGKGNRYEFSKQDDFLNIILDLDNKLDNNTETMQSKRIAETRIVNALHIMEKLFVVFRKMMQLNRTYEKDIVEKHLLLLNAFKDNKLTRIAMANEIEKLYKQFDDKTFFKKMLFDNDD